MSTEKVSAGEVLATIDECISCFEHVEECPDDAEFLAQVQRMRAAVAELIAADVEYDKALDELMNEECPGSTEVGKVILAKQRRSAALTACTGKDHES